MYESYSVHCRVYIYRYDDMRAVAVPCNDFESLNGIYITYHVVQDMRSIFFDPADESDSIRKHTQQLSAYQGNS